MYMIIYISAFLNDTYLEEAKLLIESIKKNGEFIGKIYLFTDKDIVIENVNVVKTKIDNVNLSSAFRLKFFDFFDIHTLDIHEPILYLDTDIIVLNKLPDFNNINDKINVYGIPNRTQNAYTLCGYITNNPNYINKPAMCAGILLFKPSELIKKIFEETYNLYLYLIKNNKVNSCWEQPALCYTLIKYDMMEISLRNYVCEQRLINDKNYENNIIATTKDKIFNHFCGLRGNNRKNIMKSYI